MGYFQLFWLPTINIWEDPTVEDITHFDYRIQKNKGGTDLKVSSLPASFYNTRGTMQTVWQESHQWHYPAGSSKYRHEGQDVIIGKILS